MIRKYLARDHDRTKPDGAPASDDAGLAKLTLGFASLRILISKVAALLIMVGSVLAGANLSLNNGTAEPGASGQAAARAEGAINIKRHLALPQPIFGKPIFGQRFAGEARGNSNARIRKAGVLRGSAMKRSSQFARYLSAPDDALAGNSAGLESALAVALSAQLALDTDPRPADLATFDQPQSLPLDLAMSIAVKSETVLASDGAAQPQAQASPAWMTYAQLRQLAQAVAEGRVRLAGKDVGLNGQFAESEPSIGAISQDADTMMNAIELASVDEIARPMSLRDRMPSPEF